MRVYRAQRILVAQALLALFTFLFGLPLVLRLFPSWDGVRLLGVPMSWLAIVLVPFPAMVLISRWQLRRAERVEDVGELE